MGIKEVLARQRNENRIQQRTKRFDHHTYDTEAELDETLDRVYRVGKRIYNTTQSRKGEGKIILKRTILHVVGDTTRAFLGSHQTSLKSPLSPKKKKPKGKKPWLI